MREDARQKVKTNLTETEVANSTTMTSIMPNGRRGLRLQFESEIRTSNYTTAQIDDWAQLFGAITSSTATSTVEEYFVRNGIQWNDVAEGQTILRRGGTCRDVCYVIKGLIKLSAITPGGSEILLGLCGSRSVLAYETAILNQHYLFNATSLTRCDILLVHTNQLIQDLTQFPDLAQSMQTLLSAQAVTLMRRVYSLAAEPAEFRLIATLLLIAEYLGVPGLQRSNRIAIKNRELANLVAVTPEHLSRLLSQLKRSGLVDRQEGWLVILDILRLTERLQHRFGR